MSRTNPTPEWRLGSLSPSKEGVPHYVLPQQQRIKAEEVPDKWCPASMPNLTPEQARKHIPVLWQVARQNCDHSELPSRGMG